jgi:stage II sporulation protein M
LEIILFILENNISNAFIALVSGIILGIVPLVSLFFNGYVLGYVSFYAVGLEGGTILLRLLPHGIFEIPALILSIGLGIRLGFFIFSSDIKKEFLHRTDRSLRVFVFFILPLLIAAGIIEGLFIGMLS